MRVIKTKTKIMRKTIVTHKLIDVLNFFYLCVFSELSSSTVGISWYVLQDSCVDDNHSVSKFSSQGQSFVKC